MDFCTRIGLKFETVFCKYWVRDFENCGSAKIPKIVAMLMTKKWLKLKAIPRMRKPPRITLVARYQNCCRIPNSGHVFGSMKIFVFWGSTVYINIFDFKNKPNTVCIVGTMTLFVQPLVKTDYEWSLSNLLENTPK